MSSSPAKILAGIVLAFLALFYLSPHSVHVRYSPDWVFDLPAPLNNLPHEVHISLGVVFVVLTTFYVRKLIFMRSDKK